MGRGDYCSNCQQRPCMGGKGPGSCATGKKTGKAARPTGDTEAGLPEPKDRPSGGLRKGSRIVVAPGVSKEDADAWIKKTSRVPKNGHYEWNEKTGDLEFIMDKDI